MDLATIKPTAISVEIINPGTGDETGLTMQCVSRDDPAVKKVARRQMDKRLKRGRAGKFTAEQLEEDNIELVAASIVGWTWKGEAKWNGKKPECTPEIVKDVLGVAWIRKQVEEAIGEDAEFFSAAE